MSILLTLGVLVAAMASVPDVHRIEKPQEFEKVATRAKPGDEIVVADGRHADWSFSFAAKGAANAPIVIRPATPGGVVFTGKTRIEFQASEHVLFRDFAFESCTVTGKAVLLLENAVGCRISSCRFTGTVGRANDQVIRLTAASRDNRVDRCTFVGNGARGVQIHVEPATWQTTGYPTGTRIDRNRFQDIPTVKQGDSAPNGREAIQVGQGGAADAEPRTIVEHNVFLRCDGENECISNKTSGNIYRYNSFKDQVGSMSLRGAARCVVEGNRFENTPGIRVQGRDHVVVHNVILRSGGTRKPGNQSVAGSISLGYGMKLSPENPFPQHYKAAEGCLVANNTIVDPPAYGLVIGGGKGQDWKEKGVRDVPPSRNRIVNNIIVGRSGELLIVDAAPDNIVDANLVFASGDARVSTWGERARKDDPKFRDAGAGDYRLSPDSPALKAGLSLPGVSDSGDLGAAAGPRVYGPDAPE